jgi:hypothetical protein
MMLIKKNLSRLISPREFSETGSLYNTYFFSGTGRRTSKFFKELRFVPLKKGCWCRFENLMCVLPLKYIYVFLFSFDTKFPQEISHQHLLI